MSFLYRPTISTAVYGILVFAIIYIKDIWYKINYQYRVHSRLKLLSSLTRGQRAKQNVRLCKSQNSCNNIAPNYVTFGIIFVSVQRLTSQKHQRIMRGFHSTQRTQRKERNEITSLLDRPITAASDDSVYRWHNAKLWQTHAIKYGVRCQMSKFVLL